MSHVPITAVGKTLVTQTSQANARTTGLGISAAADALLDDASNSAILDSLGFSATGKDIIDSADAAAARAAISAGVGFSLETKSSSFTAADAKYYLVDSSGGAVTATLPSVTANALIGFKLVTAGNNLVLDGDSSEAIDGALTYTMSIAGEQVFLRGNSAGTAWILE